MPSLDETREAAEAGNVEAQKHLEWLLEDATDRELRDGRAEADA